MPRDLFFPRRKDDSNITASPESQTPGSVDDSYQNSKDKADDADVQWSNQIREADERNNVYPYVQTLSLSDLESCVALENASFPEPERCSREKFIYRLSKCPELSLGVFTTIDSLTSSPVHAASRPPDSFSPSKRAILIAQVIATKVSAGTVTDDSMGLPLDWQSGRPSLSDSRGHDEKGHTLAIHSVCVLPEYQRRGLGKTIMKSYMQRMQSASIAERIALLAHEELVHWYEGLGFAEKGPSKVTFGGGGWTDMVYEFKDHAMGM